jgi:hypothetical protein
MKVTFELDSEDRLELHRIIKGTDMALALWSIRELLYRDKLDPDTVSEIFQKYDIDLDNLIE